jgi:hypothetical protein
MRELLILVGIFALFWLIRRLFPARPRPHLPSPEHHHAHSQGSAYQAVSIHCYEGACAEAQAIQGTRYLTAEAPVIPLATCKADKCRCVYQHHEDRRSGERDRRKLHSPNEAALTTPAREDRRDGPGRRTTDLAAA